MKKQYATAAFAHSMTVGDVFIDREVNGGVNRHHRRGSRRAAEKLLGHAGGWGVFCVAVVRRLPNGRGWKVLSVDEGWNTLPPAEQE